MIQQAPSTALRCDARAAWVSAGTASVLADAHETAGQDPQQHQEGLSGGSSSG